MINNSVIPFAASVNGAGVAAPEKLLKLPEVIRRTSKSRTSVYRDIAAGKFPRPVLVGARGVAWLESEVMSWVAEQASKREVKL